jgi:hypothetical protein
MRIGILTFHFAHNYGAVLQCFALQEYLKSLSENIEVEVIDYRLQSITDVYKWFKLSRFRSKNPIKMMQKTLYEIGLLNKRKRRFDAFESFINQRLNIVPVSTINDNPYDTIFIGSDQVWNYHLTKGFDDYYWGTFQHPHKTKIVSYAASMQDNWPQELNEKIRERLRNFHRVSVRESTLAQTLNRIIPEMDIETVVDPTLLLGRESWEQIALAPPIKESYLLVYQVEDSYKTRSIAKQIAERLNLQIIYLSARIDCVNSPLVEGVSPEGFVGLFKDADFVVCSSFHGTIFSLLFNKPFVSVKMGLGKDNRVKSLLSLLKLESLFIEEFEDYQLFQNYYVSSKELNKLIFHSLRFINSVVTNEDNR